jgi:hypothetical protein
VASAPRNLPRPVGIASWAAVVPDRRRPARPRWCALGKAYGGAVTTPLQPHRGTCGQLRRFPFGAASFRLGGCACAAVGSSNPRRSRPIKSLISNHAKLHWRGKGSAGRDPVSWLMRDVGGEAAQAGVSG